MFQDLGGKERCYVEETGVPGDSCFQASNSRKFQVGFLFKNFISIMDTYGFSFRVAWLRLVGYRLYCQSRVARMTP